MASVEVIDAEPFTVEQRALLAALPHHYSVSAAAAAIGIGRRTVYDWLARHHCPNGDTCREGNCFPHAFAQAKEEAVENLEARMFTKALTGDTAWDATRGIFLLKSLKREVYGEQLNVRHSGTILQAHVDITALSPEDRVSLLSLAARREQALLEAGPETVAPED